MALTDDEWRIQAATTNASNAESMVIWVSLSP
jgi:hypothetical protein